MVDRCFPSSESMSYVERCNLLELKPLQYRRVFTDLCIFKGTFLGRNGVKCIILSRRAPGNPLYFPCPGTIIRSKIPSPCALHCYIANFRLESAQRHFFRPSSPPRSSLTCLLYSTLITTADLLWYFYLHPIVTLQNVNK